MEIKELAKKYKLTHDDFWELKRSGKSIWIVTHDACEKIASIEKIILVDITVLNSEWNFCRLLVKMEKMGQSIMSIGEALLNTDEVVKEGKQYPVTKGNCESQYIGAMAEKRGIDRCILKLIEAYQYGIYSASESDSFKRNEPASEKQLEVLRRHTDQKFIIDYIGSEFGLTNFLELNKDQCSKVISLILKKE